MKIVTDSSVMLSVSEGAQRGLTVLPLTVSIEGETWLEYEQISSEDFLARVRAGAMPTSSSPPPALILDACDTEEEVVYLSIADGLSGAYEVACGLVKQMRHPERVHVLNTKTLCVPHRALAYSTVRMAKQNLDVSSILETLQRMMHSVHSYLIPEDFDYLRRGGRLTPLAAKFAHMVKAFPVTKQTDDGKRLEKLKIARSFAKAIEAIAADIEDRGASKGHYVSVSHAGNPTKAAEVLERLTERFPTCDFGIFDLSPAFITQGGPGCIAVQTVDMRAFPDIALAH